MPHRIPELCMKLSLIQYSD